MIAIIDYGLGNLRSVLKAFERIDEPAKLVTRPEDLQGASKIVLPGVGSFAAGMTNLRSNGWIEPLNELALERGTPVLGICLGMQLLTTHSEEGDADGLGWIPGQTRRITSASTASGLKVPHMGWNTLEFDTEHPVLRGVTPTDRFYFVHSYCVTADHASNMLTSSTYGRRFNSGIVRGNIIGFQFHPEKSHASGLSLLKNFARL